MSEFRRILSPSVTALEVFFPLCYHPRIIRDLAANILKSYYFIPADGWYYVILGDEYFYWQGIGGHDQFVFQNGTYYGGPMIYDPKGLLNIEPTPID